MAQFNIQEFLSNPSVQELSGAHKIKAQWLSILMACGGHATMLSTRHKLLEEPPPQGIASTSTAYFPPDSDTHGEGKRAASSYYCGNDCVNNFLSDLSDCWAAIGSQWKTFPIDMSAEDERTFQQQTVCQLCKTLFKHDCDKHRHHDHGKPKNNFIGAYCARCNLACRELKTRLPVFAHNSSYDLGLIIKELKTKVNITIMTKQGLKIQRMTADNLVFLDSLAFLGSSLDSLASKYFRDGRKAGLTEDILSSICDSKLRCEVIQGKLPFCYNYIDSLAKLKETHLPPKSAFYKLKACNVSEEEYKLAQPVWDISKFMTKNLPTSGIRKLSDEEKDQFLGRSIENANTNGDKGHWLLVTTKAPSEEVARATDELLLCLSHEEVAFRNLSPYCKSVLEHDGGRMTVKCKKLMTTHHSKKEYFISLPLLQLYMDLRLELEVVHSVCEFSQSAYMKDFIKTNIEPRSAATSSTEKNFKAMSNCVFGKTLLNPLKYAKKSKVVTKAGTYLKEAQNPRLKATIHLSEDRIICTSTLPQVAINKPNYIGFAILESAKFDLYYFFYKVLKNNYGDKVKLLYTDTDSFIFAMEVDDLNSELT
ncbi:uncharacterized protein [Palaemon carinicauda]|uniref:uncharacterized protein n=1 Tax=Palaemon carinicauda TaxID=392227 RepID=UPI0035B5D327